MESRARPQPRRATARRARSQRRSQARSTMRVRSQGREPATASADCGRRRTRSQREIAARDHEVGLAQAQDVDKLARVLESAEVRAVVDYLLRERRSETGHNLQLVERCEVEVGPCDRSAAG